jgi:hypothetical protein
MFRARLPSPTNVSGQTLATRGFFSYQAAAGFYQRQQGLKFLGSERDRLTVPLAERGRPHPCGKPQSNKFFLANRSQASQAEIIAVYLGKTALEDSYLGLGTVVINAEQTFRNILIER